MKKTYATSIVIALAALSAGQAMATNDIIDPTTGVNITQLRADFANRSGVTREQVKAEPAAQQDVIDPTTGVNVTQLRVAMNATGGKTRAQVQAELADYQAAHRHDAVDPTTGFQIR